MMVMASWSWGMTVPPLSSALKPAIRSCGQSERFNSVRPCCTDQLGWGLGPGSVEDVLLCESGTWRSLVRVAPPQSLRERQSGLSSPRWEGATPSITPGMSAVPFKANADRRHHIPKQQDRVTNWSEYDAALRQRGSLTVWFSEEAIAA